MKYETSIGIVPVRKDGDEYKFLLLCSYRYWCFPKGRVDSKDQSELETALRETEEETTITPRDLDFRWGKDCYTTEQFKTKIGRKTDKFFIAETSVEKIFLPISLELGKPEHDRYAWVSYDDAKKMVNERIGKVLDWANDKIKETK